MIHFLFYPFLIFGKIINQFFYIESLGRQEILTFIAILIATYIWIKQIKISREQIDLSKEQAILTDKQFKLANVWNKINWLTSELAIAHQKYDNLVNLHKEAEEKWDTYASWEIQKMVKDMQEALSNLTKARNDAFNINDKIIEDIKQIKNKSQ